MCGVGVGCVCVGGWVGDGRREWQSCSPRCTGRMGDVYEGEGQSCNQHTLHKNSDTLQS